jgi:hypothetical protein
MLVLYQYFITTKFLMFHLEPHVCVINSFKFISKKKFQANMNITNRLRRDPDGDGQLPQ